MARWRLKQPHYLSVPGTEITFTETNQDTGKQAKKNYVVPLYLNPEDPGDWNYKQEGIIVAQGNHLPRDIVFEGPPTPDMEPLDDEAKAITAEHAKNWDHPIEGLDGGYAEQIWKSLEKQMQRAAPAESQSLAGVPQEAFNNLQSQVTEMMKQNSILMEQLTAKSGRRV